MKARRGAERGTPVLGFCGGDHGHGPRAAQQAEPTSRNGGVENHFLYLCRQRLVGDRLDLVRVVHRHGAKANTHGSLSGHGRRELLHPSQPPSPSSVADAAPRAPARSSSPAPAAGLMPSIPLRQPRSLCRRCRRHWLLAASVLPLWPATGRANGAAPPPGLRWRRLGRGTSGMRRSLPRRRVARASSERRRRAAA